ncbi:MAG: amidohydrolase [Ktedonobacteraceae bacterium]|nr:amidohydrolase [Ktedonobacteraceae bacterium]
MSTVDTLSTYRVAAVQYNPTLGAKEKNIQELLRLVQEAIEQGARLIVLPEMATTGYCWTGREEIAPYVEPIPGPTTTRFQQLAAMHDCYIALGLAEVDPATQVYYNSAVLLGPQGLIGTYRKLHSYLSEPRWARDGDLGIPVWETPLGRMGCMICIDGGYFETARIAALRGADVLLFPTNWDDEHCPSSWWMARAFENGVYVIAANRSDCERGMQFSGGSCVLNPDGSIQAYLDDGVGIVYGEVNLERCRDKRWGSHGEISGERLADRQPAEYVTLVHNTYLWEPLRYHSLYGLGELPPGQLSGASVVQIALPDFLSSPHEETLQTLLQLVRTLINDNAPARPDIVVLPELLLPGPAPAGDTPDALKAHFQQGAIQVPGPETAALVALADELQMSMVLGVAERAGDAYYNTVLLIDPEGIYGKYRKVHLCERDKLWATGGDLGFPTFDTPVGRIALCTGYDVLFPETLRVLAGKGTDLVCAPALLDFPAPAGLQPSRIQHRQPVGPDEYDPWHYLLWRVRAAEHNVYLALANWCGQRGQTRANGFSGIFSPSCTSYPWSEVIADEEETGLLLMTVDTREQRTGQRTSHMLTYCQGEISGSLTGELAYTMRETFPGNAVRGKPFLRKRQPYWYLDLVKRKP